MGNIKKYSVLLCCVWILIISSSALVNGGTKPRKEEVVAAIFELKKGNFSFKATNYGARIISVILPDKYGKLADVVLGYDSLKEYMNDTSSFGAIIGRVANRISGAQFTLNGTIYKLNPTNGRNYTIHGGIIGFSKVVWAVKTYQPDGPAPYIVFSYHSSNGEEGYPGDVEVSVRYTLLGGNKLEVRMRAKALNKATPINLANHAYWNLAGQNSGDILSQEIRIFASKYTKVDGQLIPTGEIAPVKGTPYDFLESYTIGSKINQLSNGYDINYALDGSNGGSRIATAAIVHDKVSGRVVELLTNQPGMQFFTSNTLNKTGKGGFMYKPFAALCMETQGFPDAVNKPNFPSTIVNPGQWYKHYMLFKFSTL